MKNKLSEAGYEITNKDFLIFLTRNPSWLMYVFSWKQGLKYKKIKPGLNSLDIKVPWVTYKAISWLKHNISRDMKIFEYGTGGSTLFFASRAKELVSVEHDTGWYENVIASVRAQGYKNTKVVLSEPVVKNQDEVVCPSTTFIEHRSMDFVEYVKTIERYPDKYFDLVFVDGRSRVCCVEQSLNKIKNGGYLVLDNSERSSYEKIFDLLKAYPRKDFFGFGPFLNTFWMTSVWKIEKK